MPFVDKRISPKKFGGTPPPPPPPPPSVPPTTKADERSSALMYHGSWYDETVDEHRLQGNGVSSDQENFDHYSGDDFNNVGVPMVRVNYENDEQGKKTGDEIRGKWKTKRGDYSGPENGFVDNGPPKNHHKLVPRKVDLRKAFEDEPAKSGGITTLMIRNIPNRYNQEELLEEIDDLGFALKYDFFYMPVDAHNKCNVGYGFINFKTASDCTKFQKDFKHYHYQKYNSRKIGEVTHAHMQGLKANVAHFRKTRVVGWDTYTPLYFRDDGTPISVKIAAREIIDGEVGVISGSADGEEAAMQYQTGYAGGDYAVMEEDALQEFDVHHQHYYYENGLFVPSEEAQFLQDMSWADAAVHAQPFVPHGYSGPLPHENAFINQYGQMQEFTPVHNLPPPEATTDSPDSANIGSGSQFESMMGHLTASTPPAPTTTHKPRSPRNNMVYLKVPDVRARTRDTPPVSQTVPTLKPLPDPASASLSGLTLEELADIRTGLTLGILTGLASLDFSSLVQMNEKQRRLSLSDEKFREEFVQLDLGPPVGEVECNTDHGPTSFSSSEGPRAIASPDHQPRKFVIPNTGSPYIPAQPDSPPSPLMALPPTSAEQYLPKTAPSPLIAGGKGNAWNFPSLDAAARPPARRSMKTHHRK